MFLVPFLLAALLIVWGAARTALHLEQVSAGWVLLGIAALSVLPLVLVVLDGLASTGGSIEVGTVKIALTAETAVQPQVVVPSNVTNDPGTALADSGGHRILTALKKAAAADAVVVDLADGHAWWETRLLILCAGATRRGRPSAVVFTGVQAGRPGRFLGWGHPNELLEALLEADPDYRREYVKANGFGATARLDTAQRLPDPPSVPVVVPADQPAVLNPFLEEQFLAILLAPKETPAPVEISTGRLHSLFDSVLRTASVDRSVGDADWVRSALRSEDERIVLTESGRYVGMMSRGAVTRAALLSLIGS
ncbi:hypothetical protein [Kitasatospora sp. LaBMicrA B282]|uniref:hypothetical protein n=1 Tax=Kitasatospora sp. LaBMicrA B282 TaxID=3420949 RepID=UPI003D0F14B4